MKMQKSAIFVITNLKINMVKVKNIIELGPLSLDRRI